MTLAGRGVLRTADVVMYDRLAPIELLAHARDDAVLIGVGKRPGDTTADQASICDGMIEHARAGRSVVRLKGGDPCVFGRGAEEARACAAAGVPCHVVPGVTAALAAPTSAGIAVTDRARARCVAIVAGRDRSDGSAAMAAIRRSADADTLVVMMGVSALERIVGVLLGAGRRGDTPVACVESGTTRRERVVSGPLRDIASLARSAGLRAPAAVVVGDVSGADARIVWGRCSAAPLAGVRVVVTGTDALRRRLDRKLVALGAVVFQIPTIRIEPVDAFGRLDAALRDVPAYDWVVFTSANAVTHVFRRLMALGLDARFLSRVRVAAIGPGTARSLSRRGIAADHVATRSTAGDLAEAIVARLSGGAGRGTDVASPAETCGAAHGVSGIGGPGRLSTDGKIASRSPRVLIPTSDIAPGWVADPVRAAGAVVDVVVAYRTAAASVPEGRAAIVAAADVVVLASPSAVRVFVAAGLSGALVAGAAADVADSRGQGTAQPASAGDAMTAKTIVCIGPTTARAAGAAGMTEIVVARRHDAVGIVEAVVAARSCGGR